MADATLNPAIPFAASGPGVGALDSNAALMARVQAGDLDAFEPLVRRYERRLFGYFLNLVEDPATAADLAQETFVRVYRAAARYQESGKFRVLAVPDRRQPGAEPAAPAGPADAAPVARRSARGGEGNLRATAGKPVPTRPPGGRNSGTLSTRRCRGSRSCSGKRCCSATWRGRSYREIAEMLGVEEGTVKSRAHRGRKHLKELLAPMFEEGCYEGVS